MLYYKYEKAREGTFGMARKIGFSKVPWLGVLAGLLGYFFHATMLSGGSAIPLIAFSVLMALLFWMPEEGDTLLTICCVGAMLMGAFLLVTYFSVSIYYGEDGFLYKTLRGGKKEYRYKDIRGQRSVMTRGGINTILFIGKDEINLYSAMQNLNPFLKHAFFRWCEANGIDPDSIENNPRMFTWFPDPDGAQSGQDET